MRSSQSAGGAGISACTLEMIFFANFAGVLRELCGQKLLTAKIAKKGREGRRRKASLAAATWVCRKAEAVGNDTFTL